MTGKFQFYVEGRKLAVYGPGFHASGDGVLLDHALLDQDRRLLVLEEGLTGAVLQARHERLSALKRSLQEVIRSTTRPSLRLPACLPLFMHQVRKSSKVASAYGNTRQSTSAAISETMSQSSDVQGGVWLSSQLAEVPEAQRGQEELKQMKHMRKGAQNRRNLHRTRTRSHASALQFSDPFHFR